MTSQLIMAYYNTISETEYNKALNSDLLTTHGKTPRSKTRFVNKYDDYNLIITENYNLKHLKDFIKKYKINNLGGKNKNDLKRKVYSYLFFSSKIIPIQKIVRGNLHRKYISLKSFQNINKCINKTDFITLDEISDLPFSNFFSFKDDGGFIYGFEWTSIKLLVSKSNNKSVKNPYTCTEIPERIISDINKLKRLYKIVNKENVQKITPVVPQVMPNYTHPEYLQTIELRARGVFHEIDLLGNYTNHQWFMELSALQLFRLCDELLDIWLYRANLTVVAQHMICPPNGYPFGDITGPILAHSTTHINITRVKMLEIMEKLVLSAQDIDNRRLGAYYVLGALTIVNPEAALALPLIFQAFSL